MHKVYWGLFLSILYFLMGMVLSRYTIISGVFFLSPIFSYRNTLLILLLELEQESEIGKMTKSRSTEKRRKGRGNMTFNNWVFPQSGDSSAISPQVLCENPLGFQLWPHFWEKSTIGRLPGKEDGFRKQVALCHIPPSF